MVHHAVTVAADSYFSPLLPSLAGRRLRWEGWQCLRTLRPTRGLRTSSCGWSWRSGCTWSRRGCSHCCSLGCSWCAPPSSFPHAPAALLLHLMYIHIHSAHIKLMHHPSLTLSQLRLRSARKPSPGGSNTCPITMLHKPMSGMHMILWLWSEMKSLVVVLVFSTSEYNLRQTWQEAFWSSSFHWLPIRDHLQQ